MRHPDETQVRVPGDDAPLTIRPAPIWACGGDLAVTPFGVVVS
ncbi:hypothetical protein KZZ52_29010 [Dactylosporangium sp. AC04546]|nr:hypothetical protein [Dactylosporangium sp. AC04546]WVK89308.1 hypothetical protein KZZ52_29010 [Dactylosporangium sp. AC04546]